MKPVLETYFRGRPDVAAVFLFGSQASGKARPGSDVDIGVLFQRLPGDDLRNAMDTFMVELPARLRRDVHLVALNHAGEALLDQILRKGECVVVNNPRRLAEFRVAASAKIFDFARYREQMQAGLIRAVME